MHTLMLLIEAALAVLGLSLGIQLALYLHSRSRHEFYLNTQQRLDDATRHTVKELQQVVTEGSKAKSADGRLKDDKAHELRATAIKIVLTHLGPLGMREVRRALGLSRKTPLDRVLVGRVEAAVYDLKSKRESSDHNIPSGPSNRFSPDTVRIPRVQKPILEEDEETLYEEITPKRG